MTQLIDHLFSNQNRYLKLIFIMTLVVSLGIYAAISCPNTETTLSEIQSHPSEFVGRSIPFGGRVIEHSNHLTTLKDRGMTATFKNIPNSIDPGETITGLATIEIENGELIFNTLEFHHHSGRNIKVISGPIVLGILAILLLKKYRFDLNKLQFQPKP